MLPLITMARTTQGPNQKTESHELRVNQLLLLFSYCIITRDTWMLPQTQAVKDTNTWPHLEMRHRFRTAANNLTRLLYAREQRQSVCDATADTWVLYDNSTNAELYSSTVND